MQPREKLLTYGPTKLEGQELVAIILGSGIKGMNVFKLSKKVNKIIKEKREHITQDDLLKIKGIGSVKSLQFISAFELAKRYFVPDAIIIESAQDVLTQVQAYRDKKQEHLLCFTLDGANRLIQMRVITIGLLNQSLVHPREVFVHAISDRANSIILVHNHPSGTTQPSSEDRRITERITKVGKLVGIKLVDHIIITKNDYRSFKEQNML